MDRILRGGGDRPPTLPAMSTTSVMASAPVLSPGDPGWEEATLAFNLNVDQEPALVALPESTEQVREAVSIARARGLRIAVQRTGHNAAPLPDLHDVIL